MKKLTILAVLCILTLTACPAATTTGLNPALQPWYEFACDTYEEVRPVIIALLDAAEANPEIVPEKYRAEVTKFREDTGPRLDRGVRLLCAARAGQPVGPALTAEKRGVDWNAVALTTAKVATIGLQLYAQGKLKVPSADLRGETRETITVRPDRRMAMLRPARTVIGSGGVTGEPADIELRPIIASRTER